MLMVSHMEGRTSPLHLSEYCIMQVCQRAHNGMEYNVGVAPVWSVHSISPINFTINYTVPGSPRYTLLLMPNDII